MRSIGARGVTVLTIITLIYAPVFHHGHKTGEKLVKRTVTHVYEPARKPVAHKPKSKKPAAKPTGKKHAAGRGGSR